MRLKTVFSIILLSWICVAQSGKSISPLNRRKPFCNNDRSSAHKNEVANTAEFHTVDHKSRKLLFWNSTKQFIEKLKGVGPLLKSKVRQKVRQIQLNMRSDLISVEKMRKMREKYGPLGEGRITGTFPPLRTTEDWRPRYNRTSNKYYSSGNAYNQQRNHNGWSANSKNYHQNNYNNANNRNRYNNWQPKDQNSNQHSRQNYNNNFDRKTGSEHQRPSSSSASEHQHSNYNELFRPHAGVFAATTHSYPQKLNEEYSEDVYEHPLNATDGYDFTDSEEISTYGNILDVARKVSKYHKRYFTATPQHITTKNMLNRNGNRGSKLIATSKEPGDYHYQQQQRLHHRQQGQQQQHRHQEQQRHHKQQQQPQQQQRHGQQQQLQQQKSQQQQPQQQQSQQQHQNQQQYQDQQQQSHQRYRDQEEQSQLEQQQQQQQQQSTLIQTSTASTSTVFPTNFSTFHKTTNGDHVNGSTVVYNITERNAVMSDIEFNENALKSTSSATTNLENSQQRQYPVTTIPTSTASTATASTSSNTVNKMTTSQQVNISTAVYDTAKMSVIAASIRSCEDAQKNTSSTTSAGSLNESIGKRHHYYTGQWTRLFSSSTPSGAFTAANLSNTKVEINKALHWKMKTNIPQWGSVDHQTRLSFNKTALDTNASNWPREEIETERHSTVDNLFTGRSHLRYFNATLNPHYNADHTRRYAKRAYHAVSEALMNTSHQVNNQNEVTISYFQNPSTWVAGFFGPITKIARVNTGTFSAPLRIVQRLGYSKPPLPEWGTPLYNDQERRYQTRQPTYTEKRTQFSHRFFAGTFNPHYNVPTTRPTKETDTRRYEYGRAVSSRLRATRANDYTIRDRYFTPRKVHDRHHHHHHHHQHVPFHKQATIDYNVKQHFTANVTEIVDYNIIDSVELAVETTTVDYNIRGTEPRITTTTVNYNTAAKPKHRVQPYRFSSHRTAKGNTWTPFHKFLHTRHNNQTAWTRTKLITGNHATIIKTDKTPSFSTGTWSFSDYTPLTTLFPSSVITEQTKHSQTIEKSQVEHVTNKTTTTELQITPTELSRSLPTTLTSEKKTSTITDSLSSTTIPTIKVVREKISFEPVSATTLKYVITEPTKCKKIFSTINKTKTSTTDASKNSISTGKQTRSGRKRKSTTVEFTDKTATAPTKPGIVKKPTRKTRTSRNTRRKGPYPTAPVVYYDEMEHTNEL